MKRKTQKKNGRKTYKNTSLEEIHMAKVHLEKMLNIISCQGSALSVKLNRPRIPSIGEECGTNGSCIRYWRNAE